MKTFHVAPETPRRQDVWLADLPFAGAVGHKVRPAVVIGRQNDRYTVLMVTSHNARDTDDLEIADNQFIGLDRKSVIRTENRFVITRKKLKFRLGQMSEIDWQSLQERLPYGYDGCNDRLSSQSKWGNI